MRLRDNGISTVELWLEKAPPKRGKLQWKDGRSAKELARYITAALPDVPSEMEAVLSHFVSKDASFEWEAEHVTDFALYDLGRGEGRNHDAFLENEKLVVGIEAKADEAFGSQCIKRALNKASDNKIHRVNGMINMLFGDSPENHMPIRYQLVTAACATLLEAKKRELNKAVLMVIVFKKQGCYCEEKIVRNEKDIQAFLDHSGATKVGDGAYWIVPTVYGKQHGIDLYFSEITIELP